MSPDHPNLRASGEFYPSAFDYVTGTVARRVLLTQPDDQLRHLFATSLRRSGHAVLAACDGDQTAAVLASVSRGDLPKPHVIVVDLELPARATFQILSTLRHSGSRVPAIVLCTALDARVRDLIDHFGVFACITKPVSTALLARMIAEAIESTFIDGGSAA